MDTMLEKAIEGYFCREVKKLGGEAEKFTSPQRRSVPDRIAMFPGGLLFFVELKAPGKKPTAAQKRDHERRRAMGFNVRILDTKEAINEFIEEVRWLLKMT